MSMKRIDLSLGITADAKQAQATLQQLKTSLSEIASIPVGVGSNVNLELKQAVTSAQELQKHLSAAMDVKTGNINLKQLEASLKNSNHSLSTLTTNLLNAGLTGEKAFLATYSAIAQSNVQLRTSNGLLSQFALTLKNTAKWQLSSSLLHGVISGFQKAITYSKDLDKSLTNISIVTNKNRDSMADFAKSANKAAKELRSTTTAYTDASLIYYQQGLGDEEVKKRTDTTIKMANVLGESAKEVSSYMTAIWNNFDDGSKSLEYYGDVVANLGAKTASSSAEIAAGLEKFASIGNTVGLSYEYATSALATVVAETRQSADTVGTAFKTLFSRIQGLQLGETQEDGTDLNKYSKALAVVGVNIKDSNGELKQMDTILDELGGKWKTLANDEKMALAQTVAGVRQYTQLISLMENYDTFKQNVGYAEDSSGTLAEQQLDYEKSWEAASKNLKASGEGLITELFPTDAIVDFTNGLAEIVTGFSEIVDAAGGLKTILLLISSVVLSKFQTQIALAFDTGINKATDLVTKGLNIKEVFSKIWENTKTMFGNAGTAFSTFKTSLSKDQSAINANATVRQDQRADQEKKWSQPTSEMSKQTHAAFDKASKMQVTDSFKDQISSLSKIQTYYDQIGNLSKYVTEQDRAALTAQLDTLKALGEKKASLTEELEIIRQKQDLLSQEQFLTFDESLVKNKNGSYQSSKTMDFTDDKESKMVSRMISSTGATTFSDGGAVGAQFKDASQAQSSQEEILATVTQTKKLESEMKSIIKSQTGSVKDKAKAMTDVLKRAESSQAIDKKTLQNLKNQVNLYEKNKTSLSTIEKLTKKTSQASQKAAQIMGVSNKNIMGAAKNGQDLARNFQETNQTVAQTGNLTSQLNEKLSSIKDRASSISTGFVQGLQGVTKITMGLNMMSNAITQIKEEGLSLSSLTAILMGLTTLIPGLVGGFNAIVGAVQNTGVQINLLNGYKALAKTLSDQTAAANLKEALTQTLEKEATEEDTKAELANILATQGGMNADSAAAMASTLLTTAKGAESAAEAVNTTMVASNAAAWYAHPIMWIVAIIIAAVAAIALLTVGLMKMNAEAEAENLRMEAEAMQKLADESNKTAKANQELINSYNELFAAYKDGADNQEALLEKSLEIAEAYDNEAMKVAALRGEYDEFNRLLVKERKKEIKDTKENNDAATAATSNQLGHALREGDGHRTGSGGFYQEFDTGWGTADEEFAKNAIKNSGKTYNYLKVQDGAQGDVELNISDLTKPDEVLGAYKEVQEWVDEMNKMAAEDDSIKLGESEMYTEAMDFLSEHKEMYDKAKEYADANKALVIEEQALNTQLSNGDGIYDIDSLKEYTEYKEKYLNDIKNSDEYKNATKEEQETFLKDAEDYLGNFTHLTEFETQETLVGGIADEKEREKIIKWMDTLSDDEYAQVVMKIDKNSTLDGLKSDLEEIQEQLERETFNVKVEAAFEVEELLENGVYNDTLKEAFAMAKYEKSLDEIRKDTKLMDEFTKAWAEFVTMGREEQKSYFSNLTSEENIWGDQGNEEAFYKDKKRAKEKYQQDTEIYEADLAEYYALHTKALATREIDNINNELMKYTPDEKIKVWGYYSAAGNFVESEDGGHFQYKPNPYWTGSQEYQDLIEKKGAAVQRFNDAGLYTFTDQEVSDYLKAYDSGDTTDYQPEKPVDGSLEYDDVKLAEARAADEEAYRKALESNIEANGMETKSVYGLADAYKIMGGAIEGVSEELANDYKWATKVAYINSKIKTGLEELSGNWEVISEQLRSSDPSQQIQGLVNLEKHLSKVFNIPVGTLSEEFLGSAENAQLLDVAMSGNKEAFDEFAEKVKREIAGSDTDGVLDGFDQLVEGLKIGDKLDEEQHGKLEEYINSLLSKGRDIEQINSLLKQYGIDFALTGEHIDETGKKIKDGLDLTGAGYTGNPFEQAWENSGLAKKAAERDIEELKQLDEEIERYYEINKLLEKNAQKQERLSKIKDSAYGMKKVAAIEAESAALEEQLELQERYMSELQANANRDASNMAYFGATFNDQGVISNYESMVQAQIDKYNAAVETYNNSAQSEHDKSILEAAEKQYDLFQETLSQYDETMDELDSAATEKLEIQNALIDKALEKLQTKIEIKIEVNAMELERLEYVLEKLDDPIEDAVEAMNNLGEQTTQIISKNKEIQSGINELLEISKTRDLTANEVEQLKEWRTQLYENNKALNDIENNLSEYLVNAFEEWNKQMEKSIENLDTLTNKLETYASIIDIVGKDTLGLSSELIIDLAKSKLDTSKTNLKTVQIRLKDQKEALEEAQRQLDNATTDEEKEAAQKLIDSIKESITELENSVNDWWTTSLEDAANVFSKQMEKITEDLSNAFGGAFGSLDDLLTYQERQSKLSSEYLADYEKVYELSKLSRNIEKDIDKTDNVKAQKELAALQNEINEMMNSNEKVSKRDIEYAQKKYDLKLAEIALEEAQNAKSQVRMTRDNEGNWSYTYTADNSKVQDAEQNYEDKLYALQDFAVKSVQDLESTFTSLGKEAIEAISSIDQKTAEGKKKAEETKKYYMTLIGNTIKENEKLLKNNQEINAKYNTSLASDFKDTLFKEIYPDYNDFSQVKDEVDTKMTQGLTELGQAFSDWQTEVSNIFDLAEEPVEEFGTETMPDLYENVKNENNKIVGSVESTRKDVNEKFNNIITNLGTWYTKYKEPIDKATEENEEMAESVQDIITNYNTLSKLSATDITLTVKSPTATAVNETLSSIQEKIEAINNVTIKPGYDNSAFKQLNYDLGIVTTVKNGAPYGADEDNPHQREYYHTSRGWYSKGDTGLVVETDKDGNVIHASGTAVTYTDSDIEMLEKLQSNYANKGAIGNDPKSQHIGLQFEAEKGIKMYNSSGDETTVNYPSNSYHPNIVATDKARLINGKLCLWIDDAEDAGPNKKDSGKNTKGEQYSWDSIVGSYKYMPIEYLFVNDTPLKDKLQSLDTGGYTGDWGNEGRLAMLHQKEIVLNAYDTENFLRAVEIVREIAGIIDLNAQAASFGLGNINASAVQNHNQTIEQEVTIHAEFPNATNHSEIEEAFNNLINTASQYANRKNR